MAADTSGSGGFMFKHGEKLGLGLAGAVLVGFAGYAYGMSHDEETIQDAQSTIGAVKSTKGDYKERQAQYEARAVARATTQEWSDLSSASAMPEWAGNYPTRIEVREREKTVTPTTSTAWVVPDITFTQARVDLTGVTLEYELGEVREVIAGTNLKKAAEVTGYEFQRKTLSGPKTGDWETIEDDGYEIGPATEGEGENARSFTRVKDRMIDPKTQYAYRIRVLGESKDARKEKLVGRLSNEKEVRTRGDFSWEPQGIVVVGNAPPQIRMVIYKFDRKYNRELMFKLPHLEGDRIGVIVIDDIPPKIVTTHTALDPKTNKTALDESGKRLPPIDFNTGALLKKVEVVEKDLTKRTCDLSFDGGEPVCKGLREVPVPYSGKRVAITDDEGADQEWWFPPLPPIKDDVCDKHAAKPDGE